RRVIWRCAVEVCLDHTLTGRTAGALAGLRDALLAQDRERLVEVSARLLQRVLAVHESCAGTLSKLLDQIHVHGHPRASSSSAVCPMNSSSETVGRQSSSSSRYSSISSYRGVSRNSRSSTAGRISPRAPASWRPSWHASAIL